MTAPEKKLQDPLPIKPFAKDKVWGNEALRVAIPGSKSITNRALIMAALNPSDEEQILINALCSRDTELMIAALAELGMTFQWRRIFVLNSPIDLCVRRPKTNKFKQQAELFVGNAGTVARFLTAFLATQPEGVYSLDGDAEMRDRPMGGLIEALKQGGTHFEFRGKENCFPFTMRTCAMREAPDIIEVDASASSQILSALMMTAPFWEKKAGVRLKGETVSEPFIRMTYKMMDGYWKNSICEKEGTFLFQCVKEVGTKFWSIDVDATAASYFLSLPLVVPVKMEVKLGEKASYLQGDVAYLGILKKLGFDVKVAREETFISREEGLTSHDDIIKEDFNAFSDTFLTLAALTPLLKEKIILTGLAHTRHQETNRINAMATELRKLGQQVEETEDSISVTPDKEALKRASGNGPVSIATYKDHRVAMSFAILGSYDLWGDGRPWIAIEDPATTGKTFPDFFEVLEAARKEATLPIVTIDGGAASGKSSTARGVATKLNFMHVDTGSHYRAITFALMKEGVSAEDIKAIKDAVDRIWVGSDISENTSYITVKNELLTDIELRSPEVNAAVSKFAAVSAVREFLKDYQRSQRHVAVVNGFDGLVMEGRDIGSVIFPDAPLRFFLEADESVRAARRAAEGQTDAIGARDAMDKARKTAPLICPEGATRIDNSRMSLDEVVSLIEQKLVAWVR